MRGKKKWFNMKIRWKDKYAKDKDNNKEKDNSKEVVQRKKAI